MRSKLFLNNAPHLSSKEAATLTGYSSDYISRLCRSRKLDGQLVGKTWYVREDALSRFLAGYKKELAEKREQLAEVRKVEYRETAVASKRAVKRKHFYETYVFGSALLSRAGAFAASVVFVFGGYLGARSLSSDEGAVFIVHGVAAAESMAIRVHENGFAFRAGVLSGAELLVDVVRGDTMVREDLAQGIRISVSSTLSQLAALGSANDTVAFSENVARFVYTMAHVLSDRTIAFVHGVGTYMNRLTFAPQEPQETKELRPADSYSSYTSREGLVVVPSSGDSAKDDVTKERIRKSFSDDVAVLPDEDGTAGMIQPIFRDSEGDQYLYVLVPIEEEEKK